MGHYETLWKTLKINEFCIFMKSGVGTMGHYGAVSKTLDFAKTVLGTMRHYETLSKTLKINEFCIFINSGHVHYGALWNTIKNLEFCKNSVVHYGGLWDNENRWICVFIKSHMCTLEHFETPWSIIKNIGFCKNCVVHFGTLWCRIILLFNSSIQVNEYEIVQCLEIIMSTS